jgi:hypothetical protein
VDGEMKKADIVQEAEDLLASKATSSFKSWQEPNGRMAVKIVASAHRLTTVGWKLRRLRRQIRKLHRFGSFLDKPNYNLLRYNRSGRAIFILRISFMQNRDVDIAKDFYEWVIK